MMLSMVAGSEEEAVSSGFLIGTVGGGVVTAEQVIAVNKARQRLAASNKE